MMSNKVYILNENVQIEQVRDHWVVYVGGEFFCSADTYLEGVNEYLNQSH